MSDCIEWTGYIRPDGYGKATLHGEYMLAHRKVWIEAHGWIPSHLEVRHKCDNKRCINLDHLELGTRSQNMIDRVHRGKRGRTCKLRPQDIPVIRERLRLGHKQADIAADFGVQQQAISAINTGAKWSHA